MSSFCEMTLDDVQPDFRKEGFSGHTGLALSVSQDATCSLHVP